jgi:murein DD-endopeptidase MepM/ murein hydrolase activator NlpD
MIRRRNRRWPFLLALLLVAGAAVVYGLTRYVFTSPRTSRLLTFLRDPQAHPEWNLQPGDRCGAAPFAYPTRGMVGFVWDDSFNPGHRHQGIDLFGGEAPGLTPVYAAYAGYLSRQTDWKSTLIIRIPSDPLQPDRQIWTYYTHLADADGTSFIEPDFPPGTLEKFVEAGTLLGYQGNYSGNVGRPVGVHLHFSIVLDSGQGRYLNELEIENTLDPSPYFGRYLNANDPQLKSTPQWIGTCK